MLRATLVLLLLLLTSTGSAQTPITSNSGIAFAASPDHDALNADGTPVLDHYQLNIVAQNDLGAIAYSQNLLKPTPDATGTITVKPVTAFASIQRNTIYQAQVVAVGPGGASRSELTDPFVAWALAVAPRAPAAKPMIVP